MNEATVEIRADGAHVRGYVNIPGRRSKPIITPRGKVIEIIEQRAFDRAIKKADNIDLKIDHNKVVASTGAGTLKLAEDEIGLRAEAIITDAESVAAAKAGKMRGWSFGMKNPTDEVEQRADGDLPIRHVKDMTLTEVTIAVNMQPAYAATLLEVRAGADEETETERRAYECDFALVDKTADTKPAEDDAIKNVAKFRQRLETLTSRGND